MGLQEKHNVPDLLLFNPGSVYHGDSFVAYSLYLFQFFNVRFNNIKRLGSECLDNACRHNGSDSFDEAGSQIFSDTVNGRRGRGLIMNDFELFPKSGVGAPFPFQLQYFARRQCRKVPDHRYRILPAGRLQLGDGKTVLIVTVGDSFYLSLKICQHV